MAKVKKCLCRVAITCSIIYFIYLIIRLSAIITIIVIVGFPKQNSHSDDETLESGYKHGAVASDSPNCSKIGVAILKKNGSAVDSAIATLFCIGVHNLQLAGIGGGGFLMYYNSSMKQAFAIDFREKAPQEIPENVMKMFKNNSDSTRRGGLAIGVPGQVKGLYEAHQQFGRLSWAELVQLSIELAEKGVEILPSVAKSIEEGSVYSNLMKGNFPNLKQLLISPNGQALTVGSTLKQPQLATTLRAIAEEGPDYFYNSNFTKKLVKDLREQYNSILTFEDFKTYTAVTRPVLMSRFDNNMEIYSFPPPASGAMLALILNILDDGYLQTGINLRAEAYHRIVEAFKFGYGQRMFLGDPDFNNTINEVVKYMMYVNTSERMRDRINDTTTYDDTYYKEHLGYNPPSLGTTHLCVLDEQGDGVAITSTINNHFGSLVRLSGVLFNNQMDDFSIPGRNNSSGYPSSESNYLRGGHRPLSSAVPTIITKNGKIVMIVGAAGGMKIPTATVQVILNVLKFVMSLNKAVSSPRLHHQLLPNNVTVERDFPESYIEKLRELNHIIEFHDGTLGTVQAIFKTNGEIYAVCDKRRDGQPAGY